MFSATVKWGKRAYSWNRRPTPRRCGGTKRRAAQSAQVSSPKRMKPASGWSSPARQRSTVVLPAPEGPYRTVTRASSSGRTSAARTVEPRTNTFSMSNASVPMSAEQGSALERVGEDEHRERHDEEEERGPARGGVVELLDGVVDRDRERPRGPRDVAADHEDHPELPERMREREHGAGDDTGQREREAHAAEGLEARLAQAVGRLDEPLVHPRQGGGEGLHREGEAVEDRRQEETLEAEGERVAGGGDEAAPEGRPRAERDEQVEAEHRRRQDERERHHRLDEDLPAPARRREPVCDGEPEGEERERGERCEQDAEAEGGEVHGRSSLHRNVVAVALEHVPRAITREERRELTRERSLLRPLHDHASLFDALVARGGHRPAAALVGERGSLRQRERQEPRLSISALRELGGLGDALSHDEPAPELLVEPSLLERALRRASVGSQLRVGDGELAIRVGERLAIGEALLDDLGREVSVAGEEQVERSSARELREEVARGAEGGLHLDAGLSGLEPGGDLLEGGPQVGRDRHGDGPR